MQFTLSHLSWLKEQEKEENWCAKYEKSIKINQAGVDDYYSRYMIPYVITVIQASFYFNIQPAILKKEYYSFSKLYNSYSKVWEYVYFPIVDGKLQTI